MIQKDLNLLSDIKEQDQPYVELIGQEWFQRIGWIFRDRRFHKTANLVEEARKKVTVYPKRSQVFRAFKLVQPSQCKVVIIGQDPYNSTKIDGTPQADGLAFSCKGEITPTLRVILKELDNEYSFGESIDQFCYLDCDGDLTYWAEQGILLVNSALTVEKNKPKSHSDFGWNFFIRECIKVLLTDTEHPKVFMVWRNSARDLIGNIDIHREYFLQHCFIEAAHPVVESYKPDEDNGFYNSNCFINANKFLKNKKLTPIIW